MKSSDLSRAYRVAAGAQAAALDHPLRQRLLLSAAQDERSLGQFSRRLGEPLAKLHYHVGRLVACGLLRVSRIERRAGRGIRHYRAVAESFLVSIADVGELMGDRLAGELRRSLAEQAGLRELFLHYHSAGEGQLRVKLVDLDGGGRGSRAFEYWKILQLKPAQRLALADELAAVITRYEAAAPASGGEPFLVHAAFAPKPGA